MESEKNKSEMNQQENKQKSKQENKPEVSGKVAIVLVRGMVRVSQPVKDTLAMLRLNRKNHCVVISMNDVYKGMLKKVKDYVTWGEITEDLYKELIQKRGEEYKGRTSDSKKKYTFKTLEFEGKHYKPYFRLNPPKKGFGRKGIKMAFKLGGGLGYRGDKMADLVTRML
jgi:large subunit ribosomal protein L30